MKNRVYPKLTNAYDYLGREAVIKHHEENHLYDVLAIAPIWTVFFVLI